VGIVAQGPIYIKSVQREKGESDIQTRRATNGLLNVKENLHPLLLLCQHYYHQDRVRYSAIAILKKAESTP